MIYASGNRLIGFSDKSSTALDALREYCAVLNLGAIFDASPKILTDRWTDYLRISIDGVGYILG